MLSFFLSVAGVDYEAAEDSLRLDRGEVNQCFNVDILDDNILEEPENFMVHLGLADGTSKDVLLGDGCIDTEVIIIDMNGIYRSVIYESVDRPSIRASVDALYRDGANVRGDAHMRKSFQAPRMCEYEPS